MQFSLLRAIYARAYFVRAYIENFADFVLTLKYFALSVDSNASADSTNILLQM